MKDGIVAVALMLMLPPGAAAQQRFEVLGAAVELPPPVREAPPEREKKCEPRSSWLTPLLATHTALQIAHTHSTRSALKTGWAREANPFMGWVMARDARAYTVKAGSAAGFWWWLDTYACEHPRGALWTAISANALYGFLAGYNYSRLETLRRAWER